MTGRHRLSPGRAGLHLFMLIWCLAMAPALAFAAPYAGFVMDARSGETLHSENADTPLHPASLTKMMTLYITFEAVQHGEITMDDYVTVSRNAAAEPPSKLGLRQGQKIKLRYLVRAAAIKSANDAATAIGEHISGSEDAFAARMTRTARALGMSKTTFKNAHGLTLAGHLSTAHDMAILGRHMVYDYPQYYGLFSRISEDAGIREVANTNRRFLASYKGADGIKTGYTNAAGFNLVASAQRGDTRIISVVFGGRSTASRNARVAELLDYGFGKAKKRVALNKPSLPPYMGNKNLGNVFIAESANPDPEGARGKTIRVVAAAPTRSLRPQSRAGARGADVAPLVASLEGDIETVLAAVQSAQPVVAQIAATDVAPEASAQAGAPPCGSDGGAACQRWRGCRQRCGANARAGGRHPAVHLWRASLGHQRRALRQQVRGREGAAEDLADGKLDPRRARCARSSGAAAAMMPISSA